MESAKRYRVSGASIPRMPSVLAPFFSAQYWRMPSLPLRVDHWPRVGPMTLESHQGHAVATRIRHPPHDHDDDGAHPHPRPAGEAAGERLEVWVVDQHDPALPCKRTIRGGPTKAQSMMTIRPFSRRCAMVSTPLPGLVEEGHRVLIENDEPPRLPFGGQLTGPQGSSGAVDTKKTGWSNIHWDSVSSILP